MARYELWVEVPDRPGNLAALAGDLAACGANIVHLDVHAGDGDTVIDRLVVQLPDRHGDRLVAVADRYGATLRPLDGPGERADVDDRGHTGRVSSGASATRARARDEDGAAGAARAARYLTDALKARAEGDARNTATDGDARNAGTEGGAGAWRPPLLPSARPGTPGGGSAQRDVGRRPPTTLERLVALADGGLVRLRHLSAGDRDALVAHHLRCSAATRRHSRFLAPGALPAPIVIGEASPDGCRDHVALAALVGRDIVGAARYDREGTGPIARAAVIVEDRHQRRGIGSLLVSELAVLAANADLRCLRAIAPGGDDALRGTLRRAGLGFTVRRVGADTALDCGLPQGLSATA